MLLNAFYVDVKSELACFWLTEEICLVPFPFVFVGIVFSQVGVGRCLSLFLEFCSF